MLTREFFQREHIDAGKDLGVIAAETGFSRKLLARHARQVGIPLVPSPRHVLIDPVWLREQADVPSTASSTSERPNGIVRFTCSAAGAGVVGRCALGRTA